ncbi:glycogen/starch synthase [Carbonactinospora thermoautotrophica]|uniref:glycogen/starch synthase n=1 Tax=Carbonactinospora thermoautotrophica TaxID=1469144 RepID=UPI00226F71F3|nr:glycogen/starch synthase [Carbonactinospora thermoautotrophica]
MRILLLSWEYPPVIYGGLGRHVHALAAGGHEVTVVTQHPDSSVDSPVPYEEVLRGVHVVRVRRTRRHCRAATSSPG